MDILVTTDSDNSTVWHLTDLLGRAMGSIILAERVFTIVPAGHAEQTMTGLKRAPYASLDDALASIEQHTRGVCRHA